MFFKAPDLEEVSITAGHVGSTDYRTPLSAQLSPVKTPVLHWRQTFFGWDGLCGDLKKKYPAGWRANVAGFVGVMLGGVDVRVYRRYGGELVDWDGSILDVDWAVRPRPAGRNERISTTMERIPDCLAEVFLKAVLGGHELDPASVPDWLRGALKEAVRLEHERVDRLFRGL